METSKAEDPTVLRIIILVCGAGAVAFFVIAAVAAGTNVSSTSPLAFLSIGAALFASAWTLDAADRGRSR